MGDKIFSKTNLFLQEKQYMRDEENRIVISMHVKDDTDFLSVFSTNETPVISGEVAEFIENSTHTIRSKEQLTLQIKSDCIDELEKKIYPKAIKEYYIEHYHANEKELKRNNFIAFCLAILGIFVLTLAVFLNYNIGSVVWAEVVDIVAWVFLWEAVDIKFFKTRELSEKRKRFLAFISMKIEFIK